MNSKSTESVLSEIFNLFSQDYTQLDNYFKTNSSLITSELAEMAYAHSEQMSHKDLSIAELYYVATSHIFSWIGNKHGSLKCKLYSLDCCFNRASSVETYDQISAICNNIITKAHEMNAYDLSSKALILFGDTQYFSTQSIPKTSEGKVNREEIDTRLKTSLMCISLAFNE